jgi:hypothetical protein
VEQQEDPAIKERMMRSRIEIGYGIACYQNAIEKILYADKIALRGSVNLIQTFFLKAKHWQVFTLLFLLPQVAGFVGKNV